MIDSKWRGSLQPCFNILARLFIRFGISPNTITWSAFIVGLCSGIFAAMGYGIAAVFLLWLSGLLDVMDGSVARIKCVSSRAGAYMDLILDRMVEAFFIFGFAYRYPQAQQAYLLFYIAVIFSFTTFIVAGALFKNEGNKAMHYDVGLAERTETFITFSLMALLPAYSKEILMVFNGIVFLTGIIRFYRVLNYSTTE